VDDIDSTAGNWHPAALTLTLGGLGIAAALNWQPLALLVDTVMHWPNIAMAWIQVALIACTAGICVLITTVAWGHKSAIVARYVVAQYSIAATVAAASMAMFLVAGRRLEMPSALYLQENVASSWLLPLVLYVPLALTLVSWTAIGHTAR
jgi:hypothetical protein